MTAISISLDDVRMLSLLITLILFPVYITTDSTPTQCEAVGKYKVLHYESCSKYYLCVNGEVLETGCFPILRRYNNATQSCQWFWQTPCETSPPAPSLNLTLPVCSPKDIYSNLYPGNCKKYYYCNLGVLTVRTCDLFKQFDPVEKKCRFFFRFTCSEQQNPRTPK